VGAEGPQGEPVSGMQ